jgi:phosphopantetheine--protein transferase-like protein
MSATSFVDVHIWFQDTESLGPEALALAGQVLSQEERTRRDRFRSREDQRDYAAAHNLLRRSLSKHCPGKQPSGWRFEKDAMGKPYLGDGDAPAAEFSLSHTRGLVACAISTARVGIDVERVRQNVDFEGIAQSSFSHQEIEALWQLPASARSARVLELWTLKEAFLKATGRGLSGGLDSMRFEILPSRAVRFHPPVDMDDACWKFALFTPHPEAWMAVAVESRDLPRVFLQGREVPDLQDAGTLAVQRRGLAGA